MENQLILKDITAMSSQYQEAMEIHRQIMANGVMAALALVELCRNLKLMRDRRAYEHLGFDTFDDYVEQMAGIKRRQAYNYISTLERLGLEFLQSNAQLGITKLELLAQLPESTRDDLVTEPGFEDKSAREIKDLVAELTKAKEQISWLENDKQAAEEESADIEQRLKAAERSGQELEVLRKKVSQLEAEKAHLTKAPKADDAVDRKAIEEKIRQKVEVEKAKEINEIQKLAIQDRRNAFEDGKQSVIKSLATVEAEKAEALARAQELEKRLQVSGISETVIINHLFVDLRNIIVKLTELIGKVEAGGDPDGAAKFRGAIGKFLGLVIQSLGTN